MRHDSRCWRRFWRYISRPTEEWSESGYQVRQSVETVNLSLVDLKVFFEAIFCTHFSESFFKSAARELHAWSKYNDPNVVKLLGVAQFRDRIAMVSAWMDNGTLNQYLSHFPDVDRCLLVCTIEPPS
jgi:hypothetical protein